jgi:hypothetical protein
VPLELERVEFASVDWDEVDRFPDRNVFQTAANPEAETTASHSPKTRSD